MTAVTPGEPKPSSNSLQPTMPSSVVIGFRLAAVRIDLGVDVLRRHRVGKGQPNTQ